MLGMGETFRRAERRAVVNDNMAKLQMIQERGKGE